MMTRASKTGEQAQSQPAELLTDILDLERLEVDLFRGKVPMRTSSAYSEVKSPLKLSSRPGERCPNNARSTRWLRPRPVEIRVAVSVVQEGLIRVVKPGPH